LCVFRAPLQPPVDKRLSLLDVMVLHGRAIIAIALLLLAATAGR
jgi:hypothetical protein